MLIARWLKTMKLIEDFRLAPIAEGRKEYEVRIRVPITRSANTDHDFVEYPETLSSVDIDLSDRKFIALSNANDTETTIAQASDSKWIGWTEALKAAGISVEFLCKRELSEIYQKKMG